MMKCYQQFKNLKKETIQMEKYMISNVHQESKADMKNETSINKIYNMLNNLLLDSDKVLHLPENMAKLAESITELDFSENNFQNYLEFLNMFKNLEKLLICNNIFQTLPNSIAELKNLHTLNISHNHLTDLPENFRNLKNLTLLDLSYNHLKNLPASFSELQKLKELNISNNKFTTLPNCIVNGMGTLRVLNISFNPKINMNIEPCSKYLETFVASQNQNCSHFPDWILNKKFFNLNEVILDKTVFELFNIMDKDGNSSIKTLSIICSNISTIILNNLVNNMVCLKIINVGNENSFNPGNVFNTIPTQVLKNPKMISVVNFRGTGLSAIPADIKLLCNLRILDLGVNSISWFPEEFCELYNLESLKIDGNGFIMFPENIGNLKSLQDLRAQHNTLSSLPKSFQNLKNLKFIDFYDNCFEQFPVELFEMNNLLGLDFEQNFIDTNVIKIQDISYSILRENYLDYFETIDNLKDIRNLGMKSNDSVQSEESEFIEKYTDSSFSEEDNHNMVEVTSFNTEKNWDSSPDSDDEFDPTDHAMKVCKYSKQHLPVEINNFCPADLHSKNIKIKVASMRKYGSLPLFEIQEGQFDDD